MSSIHRIVHRRPRASNPDLRVEWSEELWVGAEAKMLPQMRREEGFWSEMSDFPTGHKPLSFVAHVTRSRPTLESAGPRNLDLAHRFPLTGDGRRQKEWKDILLYHPCAQVGFDMGSNVTKSGFPSKFTRCILKLSSVI